ncbi:hypothetical protein FN846DRAFT_918946 [Sphaerosporella brunnea]|uniref:Uncharacterized protein n=1 Tax=Sphaerosporella brunnea TaxID=1250544 RepID=A0A5J5EYX8_9PEZI|nr:hypothetical protein FN846DRAFT_918946 [Sphaerosporella brunnea]
MSEEPMPGSPFPAPTTINELARLDANHVIQWLTTTWPWLLTGSDLEAFRDADVDGDALSVATCGWLESCGLPKGTALSLTQKVKRLAGPNVSLKRSQTPPTDECPAKKTFQRSLTLSARLMASINDDAIVPNNLEKFCDPSNVLKLPFMYIGEVPSDRFIVTDGCFNYYGRECFADLSKAIDSMAFQGCRKHFLHGSLGTGKSHLLAALVCWLTKTGRSVVYLPDCRAMLQNTFTYIQKALRLTFFQHEEHRNYIQDCTKITELIDFCEKLADGEITLYFVIDQLNALDPQDETGDRYDNAKKADVRDILEMMSAHHLRISSSSANYLHGHQDRVRASGEKHSTLYEGLTTAEMAAWWEVHGDQLCLKLDLEDKLIVEQLTGRLPILLRAILAIDLKGPARLPMGGDDEEETQTGADPGDASGITFVEAYAEKTAKFMARFWASDKVQQVCYRIQRFCLESENKYFDTPSWTFYFLTVTWYQKLTLAGSNPGLLGFLVEHMVLSWISMNGLEAAGKEFRGIPLLRTFYGSEPVVDPRDGFTIYVPLTINYKAVDAVMVFLDNTKKEVTVAGVQITISQNHRQTEEDFFKDGAWWRQIFHGHTVVFKFLWLMEDRDKRKPMEVVPEKKRTLAKREIIACPEFERRHISIKDFSKEIADKLQAARAYSKL